MRSSDSREQIDQLESKYNELLDNIYKERSKARCALWKEHNPQYVLDQLVNLLDGRIGAIEEISAPTESGFKYKVRRKLQSGKITLSCWVQEDYLYPYVGKKTVPKKKSRPATSQINRNRIIELINQHIKNRG